MSKLSKELESEIILAYQNNVAIKEIQRIFNIGKSTFYRILKRNCISKERTLNSKNIWANANDLISYYKQTESKRATAKYFKTTTVLVDKILKKYKIEIKHTPKKFTKMQEKEIIEFYLRPNTITDTAKKFNINVNKIYSLCKKYNVPLNDASIAKKVIAAKKTINLNKDLQKEIVKFYNNHSVQETTDNFKISRTVLYRILKENNILVKTMQEKIELEKKETQIILDYTNSIPLKEICDKFNITEYLIYTILNKHKIDFRGNSIYFSRYAFKNNAFDSFPELCFYLYYFKKGINIRRKVDRIAYLVENKLHYYYPDFQIDKQLYELKGPQFLTEDGKWCNPYNHNQDDLFEAKHQCALVNNVIILYEKDYQKYIDWFNESGYKKEDFIYRKN